MNHPSTSEERRFQMDAEDTINNLDIPVREILGMDDVQPKWIVGDQTGCDIAAIMQGGCASGAYMPAVTYYQANDTMAQFGDEILEYIEESYGEIPQPNKGESWSGIAVFYLSVAVELWATTTYDRLIDAAERGHIHVETEA